MLGTRGSTSEKQAFSASKPDPAPDRKAASCTLLHVEYCFPHKLSFPTARPSPLTHNPSKTRLSGITGAQGGAEEDCGHVRGSEATARSAGPQAFRSGFRLKALAVWLL